MASSPSARWSRPVELDDRSSALERAVLGAAQRAQGVEPHDLQPGVRLRQALAHRPGRSSTPGRRAAATMASHSLRNASCWPSVEAPRSKARGPWPPASRRHGADHVLGGVRAPSKNTSLNSLSPVTCTIGRISSPAVHGHQQVRDPLVLARRGGRCGPARSTSRPSGPARSTPSGRSPPTRRRRGRPGSPRWPDRCRRWARSSPGTTAPRPPRSAAGTGAAARASRRR